MANGASLVIKITGDAKKFKSELDRVERQVGKTTGVIKKAGVAAARSVAIGLAALAAGATAAAVSFARFEASFTDVVTLLDKSSFSTKTLTEGIDGLKKGILELRAASGESFDNLNKGLFDLISAGVDAEDAIQTLAIATNLAIAGATNTSVAVDGLTSALNAFELEADQAESISQKFFTAQKFGKTTVEELSRGFGLVASTAKSFGVSLDELLASVAAVTTGGIATSQAYTGLAAIFANISKPTKDATDEAKRLGIEFNSTALRAKGFDGFLKQITESAKFNEISLEKLFGSVEAVKTILALTGAGADDFTKILEALANETETAETFQAALAAQMDTTAQRMRLAKGALEVVSVEIGEELVPVTEAFIDLLVALVPILRDTLVPAVVATLEKIEDLSSSFAKLTKNVREFFNLDVAAEFNRIRDMIESGGGLELPEILPARFDPDITEEELVRRTQENIAQIMSEAREVEAEANAQALEERIAAEEVERERIALKIEEDRDIAIAAKADEIAALRRLIEPALKKEADDKIKAEKTLVKAKESRVNQEKALDQALINSAFDSLSSIVGDNKAAQTAIFIAKKAVAISSILVDAQAAAALAIATIPPPAGEAIAAQRIAFGAASAGIVAATAIPEIIGSIRGAQEGGIVRGGQFGRDTEPFLLARDEIILPSQVNPLSPNFDETFGGGLGNQEVTVRIDLSDEASQFITVGQREDRTLGVQR